MGALKIDTTENPEYILIALPDLSSKEAARDLELECKNWLLNDKKIHVFYFKKVMKLDQTIIVEIMNHFKNLKSQNKAPHSININSMMQKDLKDRSLLSAFGFVSKVEDVLPKKPFKMDVAFLKPFVEGASKAFEVQVKIKIKPEKVFIKNSLYETTDSVVGKVKLETDKFKGIIALCLSKEVFFKIYAALVGEEITSVNKDTADAAGELMNIVYGHAKTVLNKEFGLDLKPVIPEVVIQPPVEKVASPVIVVPFSTDFGAVRIEIVAI
jgi:chemotaxis protein CheX